MKFSDLRTGLLFQKPKSNSQSPFERLFEIFKELITHTSGDFDEAIDNTLAIAKRCDFKIPLGELTP